MATYSSSFICNFRFNNKSAKIWTMGEGYRVLDSPQIITSEKSTIIVVFMIAYIKYYIAYISYLSGCT